MSPSELPTYTSIASGQKVGVVGVGAVGSACAYSLLLRHSCAETVLVDRDEARAIGVAADMRYGTLHGRPIVIRAGGYSELEDAVVILVTAGVNERDGGATDRSDPDGRLRLLDTNADVYRDIVPQVVAVAPEAVIVVVTDPPDPLADLARVLAGHDRVLSTGTLLDSNRFRLHIAAQLGVDPASVDAQVIGEHGTSQVRLWSSATVAGVPVETALARRHGEDAVAEMRAQIDEAVLHANITIIEGIGASQYGIGVASARIAEAILGDERVVLPVAAYHERYGATTSLPSVVGRAGVIEVIEPEMSGEEREAFERGAARLRKVGERIGAFDAAVGAV